MRCVESSLTCTKYKSYWSLIPVQNTKVIGQPEQVIFKLLTNVSAARLCTVYRGVLQWYFTLHLTKFTIQECTDNPIDRKSIRFRFLCKTLRCSDNAWDVVWYSVTFYESPSIISFFFKNIISLLFKACNNICKDTLNLHLQNVSHKLDITMT